MAAPGPDTILDEPASIAVGYSRLIARHLHLQEKNLGTLLKGSGLSVKDLMDDRTLLTKSQQVQIVHNAMEYSGNPALGLGIGRALTPPTHGPLGFLANSSPNLATAIEDFQSFIPGRINIIQSRTEYREGNLHCYFEVDMEGRLELYRCVAEAFFLALIAMIEFVLGDTFREGNMYCAFARPHYYPEYKQYIHCPIQFDAAHNKVVVPQKLLLTTNHSSDYQNYKFALQQCQRMLSELEEGEHRMTQRVRRQLLSHPPGKLSEEDAARQNFISKRTLARRLESEGSSFQELREQLLRSLATDYLRDTTLSVEAVAVLLNYHDSSSFRRAFKRWMGVTPQEFRAGADS
ncbi:MAG: AraC family transcriptional regulator ligand-binding domain-containing protein [Pseudomonadota bacterium]